ncbi:glycylpeptide N-tetradecanoyltransferase [Clydaea vesicula]|uniref:Glycylpeptide N-tetradecanoyltransferase n=1 Tax=Clydaea vesicula TaxID=447962 RepID=A0AAD5U5Q7_9FUNG|nr:glycylpeptide N-tetradecanoyltransferase [Clydaea vesicula]
MGEDLDPSKLLATLTNDKLKLLQNEAQKKSSKLPKEMEDHKFWDTQPVVKNNELVKEDGQIEEVDIRKIRKDPYQLPSQFEWFLLDLNDELEMKNLYELLSLNYVEDDDAMFRFNYTSEFLKWALLPPGWKKEWHLGVRVKENKKLVAFISGIPAHMRIRDQ